jgi:hypothetical protein
MTLWRFLLALLGLGFVGFGFAFIFSPDQMAAVVSLSFAAPSARTDVRALYGGMEFGVGVFLLLCAMRREFVRVGLFAGACVLIATATARSVGLMLDGLSGLQLIVAVTEWLSGGLATWGALVAKAAPDEIPAPIEDPTPDRPAA